MTGLGPALAAFLASAVELVEALTIVLAMGVTRGWRAALAGAAAAVLVLAALTAALGTTLAGSVSEALLQLVVGSLLLVFGLQWLRKAVLRSAGLKALHDEEETFREEQEAGRRAGGRTRLGLDAYGFAISFKGVLLEGLEVVFIVVAVGAADDALAPAVVGAGLAAVLVLTAGVVLHRPLARVPENQLKYGVGLLLSTFGLFWVVEGLGVLAPGGRSLEWPGGDLALPILLGAWAVGSRLVVRALRAPAVPIPSPS